MTMLEETQGRVWATMRGFIIPVFSLRDWCVVLLMTLWLYLNTFDLVITYQGLRDGVAYEANRFFAPIIGMPVLAVAIKLSLAYLVLKLVERIERRTPYSGMVPLLLINLYLCWVCLHNLHILNGTDGLHFLRFFPLAGTPEQ